MNYDCWIVTYNNGATAEVSQRRNVHEVLFEANHKSGQSIKRISGVFQNRYPGNRHRRHMSHKCFLENGRCVPCAERFDALMRDIHSAECHRGDTQAVRTPLGYRLIRFLRKFWRRS
jgi:hypothetical protein